MLKFQSWYFIFLLLPVIWIFLAKRNRSAIKFSNVAILRENARKVSIYKNLGKILIFISMVLFIAALMRPQFVKNYQKSSNDGIDIVIALDVSKSMLAEDFYPNRIEAGKRVIKKFIDGRKNDRIGFVIFSGTAFTKIPLTVDHNAIKEVIDRVSYRDVSSNGTAVGMGIAVSVNRLKQSSAKSKLIILVTDGSNNAGAVSPETAAKLAKDLGIKIYSIAVGNGLIKVQDFFGNVSYQKATDAPDEELLKKIASETGGHFFTATDNKMFAEIFKKIDLMEKSKIETKDFSSKKELYHELLKAGIILLIIGIFLEKIIFIRIP